MTQPARKIPKSNITEFKNIEIEKLIQQGKIKQAGSWYQIIDMQVLNNDFSGLVKRMFVNKSELLVQLYS